MDIKKLKHLSERHVKLFDTGLNAAEKRNFQYATEIFRSLLKQEPGVLEVREKLREIDLQRVGGEVNAFRRMLTPVVTLLNQIKVPKLIKEGKYAEALDNAEAAVKFDPTSANCCFLLARAADAAELHAIARQTMETALKHHPDNVSILSCLADAYSKMGMGNKAVECFEKIVRLQPNNEKYKEALKQASADAATDDIDPEILFYDGNNSSDHKKDVVINEEALATQIKVQLNALKKMDTMEIRKKLGDLYAIANDYEKALENYNQAIELSTIVDPDLDHAVNEVLSRQFDASIREWTDYLHNDHINEEEREEARREIERLKRKKSEILIERTSERYRRNPHSKEICFELAKLLWKSGSCKEAITHFRQLTDAPQFKDQAFLFLGKCYYELGQYNDAIDNFKNAINAIKRMNTIKKNTFYSLAKCYEAVNKTAEADGCYKAIYAVDENYKDISQIIDKIYERESAVGMG